MSAIYIAARFSRRPEANALARQLMAMGHTITSRWVKPDTDHVLPTGSSEQAADAERRRFAMEDCEDVLACDWMISLMEEPRSNSRGGRHIEFGMALGLKKRLIIIGPRETVFHHLDSIEHFDTIDDFRAALSTPSPEYRRGIEDAAKVADKWAVENKVAEEQERKTPSAFATGLADRLAGAAIECNAIAAAIRSLIQEEKP